MKAIYFSANATVPHWRPQRWTWSTPKEKVKVKKGHRATYKFFNFLTVTYKLLHSLTVRATQQFIPATVTHHPQGSKAIPQIPSKFFGTDIINIYRPSIQSSVIMTRCLLRK